MVVFSDRQTAVRILDDAKRLNMLDGHFVWIWIDTSEFSSLKNATDDLTKEFKESDRDREKISEAAEIRPKRESKSDISDLHINYLLRNDQFLLFNNKYGVESSKSKTHNDILIADKSGNNKDVVNKKEVNEKVPDLPIGLLSLRPLPIRVDRHLVKGAVRLLVATLKAVLARCPDWLAESIALEKLSTSCWRPLGVKELNFSSVFGR